MNKERDPKTLKKDFLQMATSSQLCLLAFWLKIATKEELAHFYEAFEELHFYMRKRRDDIK